jgi:hypothetical protein
MAGVVREAMTTNQSGDGTREVGVVFAEYGASGEQGEFA